MEAALTTFPQIKNIIRLKVGSVIMVGSADDTMKKAEANKHGGLVFRCACQRQKEVIFVSPSLVHLNEIIRPLKSLLHGIKLLSE